MKAILLILLTIGIMFPAITNAQSDGDRKKQARKTKREAKPPILPPKDRYQLYGGIGPTAFMGDLGGGPESGLGPDRTFFSKSLQDYDLVTTRFAGQLGVRYKFYNHWAASLMVTGGYIYANDAESKNLERYYRNLSCRTGFIEAALTGEIYLMKSEPKGYLFRKNTFRDNFELYLFGGIAPFYYNPKGKADWEGGDGKWHALRELGTEGQGHSNEEGDPYGKFALAFPFGVGMKYCFNEKWGLGVSLGARYTNTDYIDDASTDYFNFKHAGLVGADYEYATKFADRNIILQDSRLSDDWGERFLDEDNQYKMDWPGRGNPEQDDFYFVLMFKLVYTLEITPSGLPKWPE